MPNTSMLRHLHEKKNFVNFLTNNTGKQVSNKEGMGLIVMDYFNSMFSESNDDYLGVIKLIELMVSDNDNDRLSSPFSADEFREVVF